MSESFNFNHLLLESSLKPGSAPACAPTVRRRKSQLWHNDCQDAALGTGRACPGENAEQKGTAAIPALSGVWVFSVERYLHTPEMWSGAL